MKQAIASCMVGVLPGDIDSLEVDECNGPCSSTALFGSVDDEVDKRVYDLVQQARQLPRKDELLLRYTVSVRSDFSTQNLLDQLSVATAGSMFEDNLQVFAAENAADDLFNVEVDSIIRATERQRRLWEVDEATGFAVTVAFLNLTQSCSSPLAVAFLFGVFCALTFFYIVYTYGVPKNHPVGKDDVREFATIV